VIVAPNITRPPGAHRSSHLSRAHQTVSGYLGQMADLYKEALWSLYNFTCDKVQDLSQTRMRGVLFSALSICGALAQSSLDSYISTEGPIAKAGLLANIGASGSKSAGAKVCGGSSYPCRYLLSSSLGSLSQAPAPSIPTICLLGSGIRHWCSKPSSTSTRFVLISFRLLIYCC
jgi:hypothetical protein